MNVFASSSQTLNKQILIVDDNLDNIIFLQHILEDMGYQVSSADSGKAALAMLKYNLPDLIFLDLMMPGMSGIEVALSIRQNPQTQTIPIVLVTAYMEDVESEDYKLFDGTLTKPVDENRLFSLLDLLINHKDS